MHTDHDAALTVRLLELGKDLLQAETLCVALARQVKAMALEIEQLKAAARETTVRR